MRMHCNLVTSSRVGGSTFGLQIRPSCGCPTPLTKWHTSLQPLSTDPPQWKGLPRPTLKLLYACQTLFGTCRNILKFNRATKSFLSQCSMVIMYEKGYYIVDVAGTKKLSRWRKQEGCALRLLQMPLLELEHNSQRAKSRCLSKLCKCAKPLNKHSHSQGRENWTRIEHIINHWLQSTPERNDQQPTILTNQPSFQWKFIDSKPSSDLDYLC